MFRRNALGVIAAFLTCAAGGAGIHASDGQGGGGNARGVKQHDGRLVAVVNNGSNSVALFRRDGDLLKFDKVVSTTSAPVSVDFGNDHLCVAGATTVDSFVLHQNSVQGLDGTTVLELAGGGVPRQAAPLKSA